MKFVHLKILIREDRDWAENHICKHMLSVLSYVLTHMTKCAIDKACVLIGLYEYKSWPLSKGDEQLLLERKVILRRRFKNTTKLFFQQA